MSIQRAQRLSESAFAVRVILTVGLCIALAQIVTSDAFASDEAAVTDLTLAAPEAIETFDIVSALAPARGSKIEPGAPPTVRLPILFEFNSDTLRPEGRVLLEKLGGALNTPELGKFQFAVEGHTDSVGSNLYNESLSQRRADAVKIFLADQGVSDGRLQSKGLGEADPVAPNSSDEGRQRNRRVEIINLGTPSE
jgi:outer membrane protein OmpA-like peptidoglycan-associated protein